MQVKKEHVRKAILQAAREAFLDWGYERADMRSIAEDAGCTVGNIYRYFQGKHNLFEVLCAETEEDTRITLRRMKELEEPGRLARLLRGVPSDPIVQLIKRRSEG